MKILSRYVLKEHLGPLIFSLTALTSLLLLNYIAKQFGNLVGKGIPWSAVAEFFLLSIPLTIELTLPMAVLVATLHAFSRLAAENEVTALKANGVSLGRLMTPVLVAAAGVTVFMLIFNDQVVPLTNHQLAVLQADIAQKKPTFALRAQVINEVSPGKLFLRANQLDEGSNLMRDVTIYDLSDATRRRTIYADSGDMVLAQNRSDLLLTLYHGSMQDVTVTNPGQLQRLFFNTDLITVKGVANQFQKSGTQQAKGNREMSVCEMQHEVERGRSDYLIARKQFLVNMKTARDNKLKLAPEMYDTDTRVPSNISLGAIYCGLLKKIGVPALGAQSAPKHLVQQGAQRPPLDSGVVMAPSVGLQATPTVISVLRGRITDTRGVIDGYEIEIHKKFALAVACFVFVMLGAPIALKFPRGGVGLTLGVSLLVFALYYIGLTAGAAAASQGLLPPAIAMWAANVIFGAAGTVLLLRMGRGTASSRGGRGGDLGEALTSMRDGLHRRIHAMHLSRERRSEP